MVWKVDFSLLFYGVIIRLTIRDKDNNKMLMVKCRLCSGEFRRITALHLWAQHRMTMEQYRNRFPDADIVAKDDTTSGVDGGTMKKIFADYPKPGR